MQVSFLVGIMIVLVGIVPYTMKVFEFNEKSQIEGPPNYEFPQLADFPIALAFMMFFLVTHMICLRYVTPLVEPIIKVQNDVKERKRRAKKAAYMLYSFIYYSYTSYWGYIVIKD